MKIDVILAGVGGQGIISIAALIGTAALEMGLNLKQAEVHGMSQRGGDVLSNLRISDKEIASDLIPEGQADILIALEPLEALRHLPRLSMDGWLIVNSNPFINIPNYPDINLILEEIKKIPNHVIIDGDEIAKDINARRSVNVILLGAASAHLALEQKAIENAIYAMFIRKGENVVEQNLRALHKGFELAS
jgi:indolepyruvate ferredoxin oxidoreductase beta subunit